MGNHLKCNLMRFGKLVVKDISEKRSGTSTSGRDALAEALDFVRDSSDILVVTRLDRLARSAGNLHNIIAKLSAKGVGFKCLQQGGMDSTTSTGKLLLGVLATIAEFETDIRKERQREGIDKAAERCLQGPLTVCGRRCGTCIAL